MTLSLEEIKERISQLSPEVRRQLDIACAADKKRKALNEKQVMAQALFDSTCRHVLLWGGSRSGKTAIIIRDIVTRALKVKSRHVVLRYRFNHVKQTIIFDTLPRVFEFFFPGLWDQCHLNKSDWYLQLPNGSQIWFGGLDDKQRTEKILGSEFSSMFFNECSEIPYASRNIAITRLAQNSGLPLKAYYDCNPPSEAHWTHRMFVQKVDPDTRVALRDQDSYANLQINPVDNRDNLPEEYFAELEAQSGRNRQRFLYGQWGSVTDNPLWTLELLDRCRELETKQEMVRMIVAVDPSGCSGDEDKRSDEVGIVVVGLDRDGKGYLLEDLSGRYSPKDWGKISVDAYQRHSADCIVAEVNYGGAMVAEVISSLNSGRCLTGRSKYSPSAS